MLEQLVKRFDAWIFGAYPTRVADLAVYRIVYATFLLTVYVPVGAWLHGAPQAFFRPPVGLPAFFTSFPPSSLVTGLNLVLALAGCLLLVGLWTRVASVAIGVVLLVLNSWIFSVGGKIDHDILFVACPLVLAFSGWGDALSLDSVGRPQLDINVRKGSWCLALLALMIGIAMFQAGWGKMTSGWLDPRSHSTYGHLVANVYATGRDTWAANQFLHRAGPVVLEGADWSAVALEMGFGMAFLHRRVMFVFLAFACLFHLGVSLLFNIGFATNVIVYAAFLPYASAHHHFKLVELARPLTTRPRLAAWLTFIPALALTLTAVASGRDLMSLAHAPLVPALLFGGAGVGAGYLAVTAFRVVTHLCSTGGDPAGRTGVSSSLR